MFVLDIYAAFTVQFVFIVNGPPYTIPFVAVGLLPSVVYLILNPAFVPIVTCLLCVHTVLFAIVILGADAINSTDIVLESLYSPALSYTLTYTGYIVPGVSPVIGTIPPVCIVFLTPPT